MMLDGPYRGSEFGGEFLFLATARTQRRVALKNDVAQPAALLFVWQHNTGQRIVIRTCGSTRWGGAGLFPGNSSLQRREAGLKVGVLLLEARKALFNAFMTSF